jgi:hypothetical protein
MTGHLEARSFTVAHLYPIALFEGEGMGTAYEYSAKLKLIQRFVAATRPPGRILIGGLPEAYGVGLDLALLVARYGGQAVVAEDRAPALEAFAAALRAPQLAGWVDPARFEMRPLEMLARPTRPDDAPFDLWVTTSAIQRLDQDGLHAYLAQVRESARYAVLLAPNRDNRAHLTLTKMRGFTLTELAALCERAGLAVCQAGYVDLPPFPPGIKRSAEAKERAAHSVVERLAMGGLEGWAHVERFLPHPLKRRFSHLVYVYTQSGREHSGR